MEKNLTIRLDKEQVDKLDEVRKHTREATYNKTIIRVIEEYFRTNKLWTMLNKETGNAIVDTIIKEHWDEISEVSIEHGRIIINL